MPRVHRNRYLRPLLTVISGVSLALTAACGGDGTTYSEYVSFTSTVNGEADIMLVSTEDAVVTRITNAGGDDRSAKWSPSRQEIAFISRRNNAYEIWVMGPDGTEKRKAFGNLGALTEFAWSPDSRRIAYEVESAGRRQIFVGVVETGDVAPLTAPGEDARLGGWSPDGDWVVYSVQGTERSGIYRDNPDGVNEIEVSAIPGANPQWSPNSRWIAFTAEVDGAQNIYVVPSGGGQENNITPNAGNNFDFTWSRDGERIAFVSDRDGNLEIYVIDASGRNERRLTNNRVDDQLPSWSRRTNRIAFASDVDGDPDVFTMRPDGSNQRRVTSDDSDVIDLDW